MAETLYLIDGSSILYRAFFAIRGLSTKAGKPTNAIFGTVKMVEKLLRERAPSRMAVVFDLPGPTFRHEAYAEYKANRPEMPTEMASQIEPTKAILRAMGLPLVELAGYEADDCIATLAKVAAEAGLEVVIVTADKDLFQLVRPGVRILHTKREDTLLDEKGVEEVFGVPPERVVDVLALWGDPTDNIPGIPGIGEKGAKDLVRQYGSLEEVIAHASEVARKAYREGLEQHAEAARFSRDLATVKDDAPLEIGLEALTIRPPDREALNTLFREHEFDSLVQEAVAPPIETVRVESLAIDDEALQKLRDATSVGCALMDGTAWFSDGERAWKAPSMSLSWQPLLELPLCVHGFKPLLHSLGKAACLSEKPGMDSTVAGYLIDPSASVPSLEKLAQDLLGQSCFSEDPAARALLLARLKAPLEDRLRDLGMAGLYREVEWPLIGILARMEMAGIGVDLPYFEDLGRDLEKALRALEADIHGAAGVEFNVASPKQVGEVLFEKLGLPVLKKTSKTKSYSTDSEVLEGLRAAHPVVPMILEYRMLSKLRGTYVDPLPSWVNGETGRIHAQFHQTVAATGRLSSSDPNLQNIPVRGDWGRRIRHGFMASKGHLFVGADYSQIELRVLAHLCQDPALMRVFERGEDIHTSTAAEVFDVAPPFVTADMRRQAKAINFGILYGMGPFGLSRELGVPQKESKAFIARYFARFPKVRGYLDGVEREVMETEQVSTLLGRRRLFSGIAKASKPLQQALLRQAVNTTVQGSAADLIKKAMVVADRELPTDTRLVLQVHDELILESPEEEAESAGMVLKGAMEGAVGLRVPLVVSLSTGKRWSDLK
jgi:DNA polymerase-1